MASTVKLGSVNFPKLLRHLGHRTNQVRDLVFARDAIFRKEVMTTKADSTSGRGSGTTSLSGPAVSFGYEESSSAAQSAGTNASYHTSSPELILPGLNAIQSPIMSRSGKLERTGHRISGECTFYLPSLTYIRALDNFSETTQFDEIETYDKLIDMERIIQNPSNVSATQQTTTISFADTSPGYEVDRIQFKIKTSGTLDFITLAGNEGGSARSLKWDGTLALSSSAFTTIDVPVRDIAVGDTTTIYKDGTGTTFTAATNDTILDVDKLYGASTYDLTTLVVQLTGSASVELKDIYLYKEAEWRVEGIKDYRDELMEVKAVRVRGDRTSRRRAYG
jgi:hypothetical protein|tara:strand:- start:16 stop:1020 length:1005 start_codon:yes stop_codon:yes gene_type:complete